MARARVSLAVVKRLPKYYRYLGMIEQKGIIRVSSQELSSITGLTASQIRQDLNHFGGFGQQGYGYNVEELKSEIEKIMGINKSYKAIIVDVFDHGKKVGTKISDYEIKDIDKIEEYLKEKKPEIAVIALPTDVAQDVCDKLVDGGIKGIWNFASLDLKLPKNVVLENVHLDESLYTLTYYMNNLADYPGTKN